MDWLAAVLTLAGTIVGASLTLIADRIRWRRDQGQRRHEARRECYVRYLASLHATSEAIRAVSRTERDSEVSRLSAAEAAFRSADLNAARENVGLLAPDAVVRAADGTFRALRHLRDVAGQGHDLKSQDYQQVLGQYQLALTTLRNVMRADLRSPQLAVDTTI